LNVQILYESTTSCDELNKVENGFKVLRESFAVNLQLSTCGAITG